MIFWGEKGRKKADVSPDGSFAVFVQDDNIRQSRVFLQLWLFLWVWAGWKKLKRHIPPRGVGAVIETLRFHPKDPNVLIVVERDSERAGAILLYNMTSRVYSVFRKLEPLKTLFSWITAHGGVVFVGGRAVEDL